MSDEPKCCPNPVCRATDLKVVRSMQTTQRQVLCCGCLMTGPMATDELTAWAKWNVLPRGEAAK